MVEGAGRNDVSSCLIFWSWTINRKSLKIDYCRVLVFQVILCRLKNSYSTLLSLSYYDHIKLFSILIIIAIGYFYRRKIVYSRVIPDSYYSTFAFCVDDWMVAYFDLVFHGSKILKTITYTSSELGIWRNLKKFWFIWENFKHKKIV